MKLDKSKPYKMITGQGAAIIQQGQVWDLMGQWYGPAPTEGLALLSPAQIMEWAQAHKPTGGIPKPELLYQKDIEPVLVEDKEPVLSTRKLRRKSKDEDIEVVVLEDEEN